MLADWGRIARDGAILAVIASIFVVSLLRANPRFFLRHYPKEIRDAVPPLTMQERLQARAFGLPFLAVLAGGPMLSAWMLDRAHGGDATQLLLFAQAFGVAMVFNTVDLVILDLLALGLMRPRWAMMPGAEGVAFRFNTLQHFRGFAIGTLLSAVIGGAAALVFG